MERLEIIGHRGAAGLISENTLAGFRLAAELGCDGIECDVWAVEGHLVVIHDDTLQRTTNGRGRVHDLGVAGLRQLLSGGAPLPWLEDLLPLLDEYPKLFWNVELKEPAAADLLLERVRRWPAELAGRLLVSSFLPEALEPWQDTGLRSALCVGGLTAKGVKEARRLGCSAVHMAVELLRPEAVARVLDTGLAVRVFTVNDPGTAYRLAGLGVRGVFTDRPDLLIEKLRF